MMYKKPRRSRGCPSRYLHIFGYMIEKIVKPHIGEIVTGVVIGIILLVVTPFVNHIIEHQAAHQELENNLSSVSLGMSKNYVDGMFGQPMIEAEYEETVVWYSDNQTEESFISAGYKLNDCVLLCLYCNNSLLAFVVVVNEAHLYRIPANMYLSDCYLLDFTYADFSETIDTFEGNVPANNDTYAYYSELHYGAGPSDYNYFILGSYKDYRENADASTLMAIGQTHATGDNYLFQYDKGEHYSIRRNVQPNVFGIVNPVYASKFNFVFQIVGNRTNGTLLFSGWNK